MRTASLSFAVSTSENTALRRKACEACRRRKLKCDNRRPFCTQCQKSKIEDDCEYKDGTHKSHTKRLLDQIEKLEARLEHLQHKSDSRSVSSELSTPEFGSPRSCTTSISSGSVLDPLSPETPVIELGPVFDVNDFLSDFCNESPWGSVEEPQIASPSSFSDQSFQADLNLLNPFPEFTFSYKSNMKPKLVRNLVATFLPHRYQLGLNLPEIQLQQALTTDSLTLSAVCLWGCHFSVSRKHKILEPKLLSVCVRSLSTALQLDSDIVDIIRATCLLCLYFITNGRLLEGRYHASAAVSLASQIQDPSSSLGFDDKSQAFWQVFYLDRCWSTATGMPHSLREPLGWQSALNHSSTDLFQLSSIDPSLSMWAYPNELDLEQHLGLQAAALYESSFSHATRWPSGDDVLLTPACRDEFTILDAAIARLSQRLPSLALLSPTHQPELACELIVAHTLVAASIINIRAARLHTEPACYQECIEAYERMVSVIRFMEDDLYQFLDPICGMCWFSTTKLLLRQGVNLDLPEDTTSLLLSEPSRLETVLRAVSRLEIFFPIIGKLP